MNIIRANHKAASSACLMVLSIFIAPGDYANASNTIEKQKSIVCPDYWVTQGNVVDPKKGWKNWKRDADRKAFYDYWKAHTLKSTLLSNNPDSNTDDGLTVASECIQQHNLAIDAKYGKSISKPKPVQKTPGWLPAVLN